MVLTLLESVGGGAAGKQPLGLVNMVMCLFTRRVVTQTVKDLPAMWETCVRFPGWEEDPLEEGMATHSSMLA